MSAQVLALRQLLEARFPDAVPLSQRMERGVATGTAALDGILPGRGLPRGRLTVWKGPGATALLGAACRAATTRGEGAAWIDGGGSIVGAFWHAGPLLVRPSGAPQALACAEELLRTDAFALVVLAGTEADERQTVRLGRAVREGGGAFVLLGRSGTAHLRLRSRISPDGFEWRLDPFGAPAEVERVRVHVRASALGWGADTTLQLPVLSHDLRMSLEPTLADRRGISA